MPADRLTWHRIDPATLTKQGQKLWENYQTVRDSLEAVIDAQLEDEGLIPEGCSTQYGYRFGGIAVAFPKNETPSAQARGHKSGKASGLRFVDNGS